MAEKRVLKANNGSLSNGLTGTGYKNQKHKSKIDKTQENYVLSECCKLDQKEYKRRHNWFGTSIYWEICRKGKIKVKKSGTSTRRR